jgi:transcriptional regulator with XRE-family HTH domain
VLRPTVDPEFPATMRRLREHRGLSLRDLAKVTFYGKSYLGELETGGKTPTVEAAARIDEALAADGALAEMVTLTPPTPAERARMCETAELVARVRASDASPATIDALHAAAFELCCEYPWRDAAALRNEAWRWMREVVRLRRSASLRAHRDLLTIAGWLGLLVGCLEEDMGLHAAAETTRTAAASLGEDAGNAEITAWAWEMAAWFALTQGRYLDVAAAAAAGQAVAGQRTVAVQLIAQEAKARARMGDHGALRAVLDRGRTLLDRFPRPARPEHHFIIDPDKWDFYAMDAFRLAGDNTRAAHHARQVLALGTAADGTERAPMRMSEAKLTLGIVAARAGELEEAVDVGRSAFRAGRRSLPQFVMIARELNSELSRRYPREPETAGFRDALRAVS